MIYFIRAKDSGKIKIGYSKNPKKRKSNLQTANYEELELLAIIPGTTDDETELKKKFSAFNIRGEWFHPSPELLEFIEKIEKSSDNLVSSLGNNEYRIVFAEPEKFSVSVFLLVSSHKIRVLTDSDSEFIFGVEGKKGVLIDWYSSLGGATQELINELTSLMID